jgi:hypothetical protein
MTVYSEDVTTLTKYLKHAIWWRLFKFLYLGVIVNCILCTVYVVDMNFGLWERQKDISRYGKKPKQYKLFWD